MVSHGVAPLACHFGDETAGHRSGLSETIERGVARARKRKKPPRCRDGFQIPVRFQRLLKALVQMKLGLAGRHAPASLRCSRSYFAWVFIPGA
jgi:hypothetical protein